MEVSDVEGQQFIALGGPGTNEMQSTINGATAQTLVNRQGQCIRVVLGGERNNPEMDEHRLLKHPLHVGGWKPRLKRKSRQRREEFRKTMGRDNAVNLALVHRQQTWECPVMMRVLLQKRRN